MRPWLLLPLRMKNEVHVKRISSVRDPYTKKDIEIEDADWEIEMKEVGTRRKC